MADSRTLVIGVGNPFGCDDIAGLLVLRHLEGRVPPGSKTVESSGDGAAMILAWEGFDRVVIVDAVRSGGAPGTIHRISAAGATLPRDLLRGSSHLFGVAEAIETARVLGRLPPDLRVLGIEGCCFRRGRTVSPKVVEAARRVADEILAAWTRTAHKAGNGSTPHP